MNWVAPIKDEKTLQLFGETLKEVDYKYYIMFELGVGTGLQLQDILAFRNKDVTDKKEITVEIGTKISKILFLFQKIYKRQLMIIQKEKILRLILF